MATTPQRYRAELKKIVVLLLRAVPVAALSATVVGVWMLIVWAGLLALTMTAWCAAPVIAGFNQAYDEYNAGRRRRRRRRDGGRGGGGPSP
jgi:hypothetical protein